MVGFPIGDFIKVKHRALIGSARIILSSRDGETVHTADDNPMGILDPRQNSIP